jgi:hypothetical protein
MKILSVIEENTATSNTGRTARNKTAAIKI